MNIALRLQELLDSRGISRSKLGREIGVHTSTVSNWLEGKDVKAENLATVCAYFNCSLDYLAGKTDERKKPSAVSKEGEPVFLEKTYLRLAQGAQELGLDDEDVETILALYAKHRKKNSDI